MLLCLAESAALEHSRDFKGAYLAGAASVMRYETDLKTYYARRASEYERIYIKPERQDDLATLRRYVAAFCSDAHVLEYACGTGYWTSVAAPHARTVLGIDINQEVLEVARNKPWPRNNVSFECSDLYELKARAENYDTILAVFLWSHILAEELSAFYGVMHRHVKPGSRVMILDNRYVEGSSTPIARTDKAGNTYQLRRLDDGGTFEILKNFPVRDRLIESLTGKAKNFEYVELDYYWYLTYEVIV